MNHRHQLRVRSYELDMHRHVNNATYLNYFEVARMEFLNEIGFDYAGLLSRGLSLFVAKISVSYKAPAFLNDDLLVVTTPIKKKKMSGVFRQIIYRGDVEICSADITWACVDAQGKPVPLPEKFESPALIPGDEEISV